MRSRKKYAVFGFSSFLLVPLHLFGQSLDLRNSLEFPMDRLNRQVCVQVTDTQGIAIPGARLQSEWDEIQFTNLDGVACIHVESGTLQLTQVEAAAMGYETRSRTINTFSGTAGVVLKRKGSLPSENTVSASELTPTARKQGTALEKQAIENLHRGELDEAERLFHGALDVFPSSAAIRNNLGIICLRRNQFDQAATWFEEAYNLAPRNAQILLNLGLIRWNQTRYEDSFRLLNDAAAHGYSNPALHYALGMVALSQGHARLAVKQLAKVDGRKYRYQALFLAVGYGSLGKKKDAAGYLAEFRKTQPARLHLALLKTAIENS